MNVYQNLEVRGGRTWGTMAHNFHETVGGGSGCRIETRLDACRSERMRIRRYIMLQRGKSVVTNLDAADMNVRDTIYADVRIGKSMWHCPLVRALRLNTNNHFV